MDTERLATSAVDDAISRTDFIVSRVSSGDKEPCWDGYLYAYSHSSKKNEYFKGKVPVQVKGQICKEFAVDELKYLVRVVDLRNYSIEGGTIYFVVQINQNGEKKIFYNALLPFELNKMLEGAEKKNKLSVKMHEFPADKNEITNIILNFVRDKESQVLLQNGTNISIEDMVKQFGMDKLTFSFSYTGLGYDQRKPYEYLFNHDIYIYAENKEMNLKVPVEHLWKAEICQSEMSGEIKVGNTVFYDSYEIVHKKDTDTDVIHIGKSYVFVLKKDGLSKMNYTLSGNLDERIIAEKMMIALIKAREVFINGVRIVLNPSKDEIKMLNIESMESHLKQLIELKEVLDSLGVNIPLDCSNLSNKDEEYIRMLILSQKYGRVIRFEEKVIPPIAYITIGNLKIMLHFKPQEDGKYFLENYTNCNIDIMGGYVDKANFQTSKFTILSADDFITISNLDEGVIVDELISIVNKGHIEKTVFTLLEMIKAYDSNKKQKLLEEAIRLASWICDVQDTYISKINLYQCFIRKRKLTDEEEQVLEDIIDNSHDNKQIKIAANILLGRTKRAHLLINKLPIAEKQVFVKYPIYSLLMNMDEDD